MVGGDFDRIAWQGIVAIDLLEKKLRETRPYERHAGETDKVYQHFLQKVYETLRDRQRPAARCCRQARQAFDDVALSANGRKPVVGIVGEIYTRANKFSNENAVREIEALGGEVWMPPIGEWLLYVTTTARHDARVARHYGRLLQVMLKDVIQNKDEHRLEEFFQGSLKNLKEPSIAETLELAKDYLHPSFEGEAILSMGKSRDFVRKGACRPGEYHALYLHARHRGQRPVQALPGGPRQYSLPEPGLRRPGADQYPHPPGGLHVPGAPVPGAAEVV